MTDDSEPPAPAGPAPTKKRKWRKIAGWGCGIPLGLFILLGVIGAITGTGKHANTASTVTAGSTTRTTTTTATPATMSQTSTAVTTTHASATTTTTTTTATTTPPKPTTPPPDRAGAAAILKANVDHYRQVFHQGQDIVDHTQYPDGSAGLDAMNDPNSAAARFRDYRKNPDPERDLSYMDAFRTADAKFNADNEPTDLISKWQNDVGTGQSDLITWVQVATDYQISAKSQHDLDAAAAVVERDLAAADGDADAIGKG